MCLPFRNLIKHKVNEETPIPWPLPAASHLRRLGPILGAPLGLLSLLPLLSCDDSLQLFGDTDETHRRPSSRGTSADTPLRGVFTHATALRRDLAVRIQINKSFS